MQAFIQLIPLISPHFLPVEILVIGDAPAIIRRGGGRPGAATDGVQAWKPMSESWCQRRTGKKTKRRLSTAKNSHACFARVIEIARRIILGVQKKPMSPSTRRNSKSAYLEHRTKEWGHWRPSEHSLMDTRERPSSILWWTPREGRRSTKCTTVCAAGNSNACFAREIEIASRIILGGPAKKPMSPSTKRNSKSVYLEHRTREWGHWYPSEHSPMDTRESPSSILRVWWTCGAEAHILASVSSFAASIEQMPELQANRKAQGKLTYFPVFCSFNRTEVRTSSKHKGASECRRLGFTPDDLSPLNALNEDDGALHLMIGQWHVGSRPVSGCVCYLNIQQCLCQP